jgi:hypothetical protein
MEVSGQLHVPAVLPQEKVPGTHFIRGSVGPRAGLDFTEEKNSLRESNADFLDIKPVA